MRRARRGAHAGVYDGPPPASVSRAPLLPRRGAAADGRCDLDAAPSVSGWLSRAGDRVRNLRLRHAPAAPARPRPLPAARAARARRARGRPRPLAVLEPRTCSPSAARGGRLTVVLSSHAACSGSTSPSPAARARRGARAVPRVVDEQRGAGAQRGCASTTSSKPQPRSADNAAAGGDALLLAPDALDLEAARALLAEHDVRARAFAEERARARREPDPDALPPRRLPHAALSRSRRARAQGGGGCANVFAGRTTVSTPMPNPYLYTGGSTKTHRRPRTRRSCRR